MSLCRPFREIKAETGLSLDPSSTRPVGGGCTNDAILADTKDGRTYFLKLGRSAIIDQFKTEKRGLELLRDSNTIRVPEPLAAGVFDDRAILILEALPLRPFLPGDQAKLGIELAKFHQTLSPGNQFGCDFDNFLGATPQPNPWTASWADFLVAAPLGLSS